MMRKTGQKEGKPEVSGLLVYLENYLTHSLSSVIKLPCLVGLVFLTTLLHKMPVFCCLSFLFHARGITNSCNCTII